MLGIHISYYYSTILISIIIIICREPEVEKPDEEEEEEDTIWPQIPVIPMSENTVQQAPPTSDQL